MSAGPSTQSGHFDWDTLPDAIEAAAEQAAAKEQDFQASSWLLAPPQGADAAAADSPAPADVGDAASPRENWQATGELEDWVVVHARVMKRGQPSLDARMFGVATQGTYVLGFPILVSGMEWLQIQEQDADGKMQTLYMLTSGSSLGLGVLLERAAFALRDLPGRGKALIAQRDFAAGETVVEDQPFFTRPKPKEVSARKEFDGEFTDEFTRIKEKLVYPWDDTREGEDMRIHASPAMVRNAMGFGAASASKRKQILELHHPDLEDEHPLVKIAGRIARLCIKYLPECRNLDCQQLQKAILAIEMNIFAGGRLFTTLSRANHSCLPNMVYIGMTGNWRFKALRPIRAGEELLHSYLGEELLLPSEVRRRHLWRSKCFQCSCERCAAETDPMRDIPCRRCVVSPTCSVPQSREAGEGWASSNNLARLFDAWEPQEIEKTSKEMDDDAWLPSICWSDTKAEGPYARFSGGTWRCSMCGEASNGSYVRQLLAAERHLGRLSEKTFFKPSIMPSSALGTFKSRFGEIQMVKKDFVAFGLDLAMTVWGILGLGHWASQWARIFCMDLVITKLEFCTMAVDRGLLLSYLLGTTNALWEWMASLGLAQDPSCFIYARAEAIKNFAFHYYEDLNDEGRYRLSELNRRLETCNKQVEILPMRPLLIEGSVCMS